MNHKFFLNLELSLKNKVLSLIYFYMSELLCYYEFAFKYLLEMQETKRVKKILKL